MTTHFYFFLKLGTFPIGAPFSSEKLRTLTKRTKQGRWGRWPTNTAREKWGNCVTELKILNSMLILETFSFCVTNRIELYEQGWGDGGGGDYTALCEIFFLKFSN